MVTTRVGAVTRLLYRPEEFADNVKWIPMIMTELQSAIAYGTFSSSHRCSSQVPCADEEAEVQSCHDPAYLFILASIQQQY